MSGLQKSQTQPETGGRVMMKESRDGRRREIWKGLYLTPIAGLAGLMRPTDSLPQGRI